MLFNDRAWIPEFTLWTKNLKSTLLQGIAEGIDHDGMTNNARYMDQDQNAY